MNRFWLLLALVVALVIAPGCRKRQPVLAPPAAPPPAEAVPPAPPPPPPDAPPAPAPPLTEEELFARKTLAELNAERPLADVYFDYDQSTLSEDATDALGRNAAWLRRWSSTRITVEGHCDARGTNEYNLALGERRAAAVRRYLVSLGVGEDRITVVSKGEEAPVCFEQDEACWSQNRRGHFLITAK